MSSQMTLLAKTLTTICSLLAVSIGRGLAQAQDGLSDSFLTGEQWRQRVEHARRRSEEFVANARSGSLASDSKEDEAEAIDQRVMNDPSLQRGDVIATSKGLRVFVGSNSEERRPEDFLPADVPSVSTQKTPATAR
jgi:hypothetical protein